VIITLLAGPCANRPLGAGAHTTITAEETVMNRSRQPKHIIRFIGIVAGLIAAVRAASPMTPASALASLPPLDPVVPPILPGRIPLS